MLTANLQFKKYCIASLLQCHMILFLGLDVPHCAENTFHGSRIQDKSKDRNANLTIGRLGRRSFQISIGSHSTYLHAKVSCDIIGTEYVETMPYFVMKF